MLGVGDERVAAEGDDRGPVQDAPPTRCGPASSPVASAARASLKHSIGAVVMPAPIWPTPALRVRDAGVDDRQHAGIGDQPRVDAGRRAAEVERRQREGRIAAERDGQHPPAVRGGIGGRAADELHDRRRRRHREAAEAVGLGDGRVAEVRRGVLDGVAGEVEAVDRIRGRLEPLVAGAAQADAEVDAVARHDRDHAAAGNAVRRVRHRLARGHRDVEEEVVVAGDEARARARWRRCRAWSRAAASVSRLNSRPEAAALRLCSSSPMCSACAISGLRSGVRQTAHRDLHRGEEFGAEPAQPFEDVGRIGAEAQHLAEALVEIAVGAVAAVGVLHHPDRHRRADDAGHRPDGAVLVARFEGDLPPDAASLSAASSESAQPS